MPATLAVPVLLALAAPVFAGLNRWTPTGPDGGTVTALAVAPSRPDTLYAGTRGLGVFRSTDGGGSWRWAGGDLGGVWVTALAVHPRRSGTLYAATFEGTLVKSRDGGEHWEDVSSGIPEEAARSVRALLVDWADADTVWLAAFTGGLFRSTDGGNHWSRLEHPLLATGRALAQSPAAPGTLYAATDAGVVRSTDGGASWKPRNVGLGGSRPGGLIVHPAEPSQLWAFDPFSLSVFRSGNGGGSWEGRREGLPREGIHAMAFDPVDPAVAYAATDGAGVYQTLDGGDSWQGTGDLAPAEVRALAVHPGDPGRLWAGTRFRGLYRSTDGGGSWMASNRGLQASPVTELALDASRRGALYAASRFTPEASAASFASSDAGTHWQRRSRGLSLALLHDLASTPSQPDLLYAGGLRMGDAPTHAFKSMDGGRSWQALPELPSPQLQPPEVIDLEVDPSDPQTVYAVGLHFLHGDNVTTLYKSADGGTSWTPLLPGPDNLTADLALDPAAPSTVYAAGLLGASKSTDGGASWQRINTGLEGPGGHPLPLDTLAVHPGSSALLYAASSLLDGGGLFTSRDGGASWSRLGAAGLPDAEVRSLALDPRSLETLYAGTATSGVFMSTDGGGSFHALAPGLANPEVADLLFDPRSPATLYAATGGGVFRYTPADPSFCRPGPTSLCLAEGRFQVEVEWQSFQGGRGPGRARALTDDTGTFWFFDPEALELAVKVVDGGRLNGHTWVFSGALTNVAYTLTVTDRFTGEVFSHSNPLGRLASLAATQALLALGDSTAEGAAGLGHASTRPAGSLPITLVGEGTCAPTGTALCLNDGRFRVEVEWTDFRGRTGAGRAVELTPDTGHFWFFDPEAVEVIVKILDGRSLNGHFWVFYGALSSVEYRLTVTDTLTGDQKVYSNPLGHLASFADSEAF